MRFAAVAFLVPVTIFAQGARPSFEVADVKPSDAPADRPGKGRILPGGRIDAPAQSVIDLMRLAYNVQPDMIVGAPKWADTERFDIVAKAPPDTPPSALTGMVQTLLEDRFKLQIHREQKQMPAYILALGKRPAKYKEGDGGHQDCAWTTPDSNLRRRTCHNMTMTELARQLPGWGGIGIDLQVIDQTGLKGAYDFELDVGFPHGREGGGPQPAVPDSGPTIFDALDKIGLKLESKKMPLQVVVVDHLERPAAN
jgi:uncharacterized protein (TIGR03435 family)